MAIILSLLKVTRPWKTRPRRLTWFLWLPRMSLSTSDGGAITVPKEDGNVKQVTFRLKICSCAMLLLCTVASTLLVEASKSSDGTFPYISFVIPFAVEAVKLCVSALFLGLSILTGGGGGEVSFTIRKFISFSLPALCYFVSNNCALLIIRELGPTNYQITCNLKVLATGVLMRIFLGRKLTWLRWKALMLLAIGTISTQIQPHAEGDARNSIAVIMLVFFNSFISGAGGVLSEKLMKGGASENIHWQNMQLYFFGSLFGLTTALSTATGAGYSLLSGINIWACACIGTLSFGGLIVSFILKYIDNFAKCFVAAFSIVTVSVAHSIMRQEAPQLHILIGIALTCMALEQYHLSHT